MAPRRNAFISGAGRNIGRATALELARRGANVIINMIGSIGDGQAMTKVMFHRYGDQYYFGEVWIDGDKDGLQAPRSKAERATKQELAALQVAMETVALRVR